MSKKNIKTQQDKLKINETELKSTLTYKKSRGEPHNCVVPVRLTKTQNNILKFQAEKHKIPMSSLIRAALFVNDDEANSWVDGLNKMFDSNQEIASPKIQTLSTKDYDLLHQLMIELNREGVNLNQIAHALNMKRKFDEPELINQLNALDHKIDKVLGALGCRM